MIIRGKRIKNQANSNLVTTSSLQKRHHLDLIRETGEVMGMGQTLKDILTNRKEGIMDIVLNI